MQCSMFYLKPGAGGEGGFAYVLCGGCTEDGRGTELAAAGTRRVERRFALFD